VTDATAKLLAAEINHFRSRFPVRFFYTRSAAIWHATMSAHCAPGACRGHIAALCAASLVAMHVNVGTLLFEERFSSTRTNDRADSASCRTMAASLPMYASAPLRPAAEQVWRTSPRFRVHAADDCVCSGGSALSATTNA
jgi:hypothetical protein